MMKTTLTIKGMHCNACKARIEDVCRVITGIHSCTADFETGMTQIEHEENLDLTKLINEIEKSGSYKVELPR